MGLGACSFEFLAFLETHRLKRPRACCLLVIWPTRISFSKKWFRLFFPAGISLTPFWNCYKIWADASQVNREGFPCGSISCLGALGGAWIWIWEFVRRRRRRLEIQDWPPWDWDRKTRFSNGMAYNRSKVSVQKSQIGFVVINFPRSIFPYMSHHFMDGWKLRFGFWELLPDLDFSNPFVAGFLKKWNRTKGAFSKPFFCGTLKRGTRTFSKISNFQNCMFQPFRKCSY